MRWPRKKHRVRRLLHRPRRLLQRKPKPQTRACQSLPKKLPRPRRTSARHPRRRRNHLPRQKAVPPRLKVHRRPRSCPQKNPALKRPSKRSRTNGRLLS
ncbi:MAG: hypothetical protein DLM73_09335 [Chthoniobacterales bacterium]|nr:MAG: hypothetical protein DLM73_09335 [Chthoniobacterales bacterium]